MNEICNLASSGLNQSMYIFIGFFILIFSIVMIKLQAKGVKVFLLIIGMFFALQSGFGAHVFAGGTLDCPSNTTSTDAEGSSNSGGGGKDNQVAIGGLIDDNPELVYDEDNGYPRVQFSVLDNDNAPSGDPFDVTTLRLISDYKITDSDGYENHLILDPVDQTMPNPNSNWWEAPNVWGYWYLELTCNPLDTDHCFTGGAGPGGEQTPPFCTDQSAGTCWPSGEVSVEFPNPNVGPGLNEGRYSINYSVKTQSGQQLLPATITVSLPNAPPTPSPVNAFNRDDATSCSLWPEGFSIDLMRTGVNKFFDTDTPSSPLIANTIDLDPIAPGRQTTKTIYADSGDVNFYVTYSVDISGILTMTTPKSAEEGFNTYILNITIEDSDGKKPDTPATYTRRPSCA